MHIISVLILMLRSGFFCKYQVLRGVDVSLRCEVSFLSESSTLQWERDGEQTSNTTLLYNNSAYIILHTVDEHNQGKYYCRLMEDGRATTVRIHTLNVSSHSYNGNNKINTIYRQSSSNSDVSLICKTKKEYNRWKWTWEQRPNSQTDLIAVENGREVQVNGPIKPGRLSSTTYNSRVFIFHISPVNFNSSGTYRCITDEQKHPYTTTMLHTIRVSVEHPDGLLRNRSLILTCEVSEVTDSLMLVCLRMERNRGVLGKQQIMTEKNNKLQLTVNLSSYETDPLHWQCAVFTEDTLRALAPITISLSSSTTNAPNQKDIMTQESHLQIVIIVVCAGTGTVLILLLGLLVFKRQRKTDEVHVTGLKSQEDEDIHYASVTLAGSSQGDDSWFKTDHASSEVLEMNSTVIYSTVKAQ
ncbi:uncharacterized protein LOC120486787 isoform X2 [Pimephales promelas]|uniref:uncharacterized protein LOC120486787 isoform X2 n=1 Tax=Pimephales promelas TaxID=90988 RepID=UPI001955A383|nr:uncharacterized protein LOC120486787 isoform X2 [Pimephales promelas]